MRRSMTCIAILLLTAAPAGAQRPAPIGSGAVAGEVSVWMEPGAVSSAGAIDLTNVLLAAGSITTPPTSGSLEICGRGMTKGLSSWTHSTAIWGPSCETSMSCTLCQPATTHRCGRPPESSCRSRQTRMSC